MDKEKNFEKEQCCCNNCNNNNENEETVNRNRDVENTNKENEKEATAEGCCEGQECEFMGENRDNTDKVRTDNDKGNESLDDKKDNRTICGNGDGESSGENRKSDCIAALENELARLKKELEEKTHLCEEYFRQLQRAMAEFDNYRKRTAKEKEALYTDAVSDVVTAFLPVIDSIGNAMVALSGECNKESLKEGIELIHKQVNDVMKKLEVEEIESVGTQFDPQLHNAIMHVQDEKYEANVIVEEFQKGYKFKDRVIRHSMVKVAN